MELTPQQSPKVDPTKSNGCKCIKNIRSQNCIRYKLQCSTDKIFHNNYIKIYIYIFYIHTNLYMIVTC